MDRHVREAVIVQIMIRLGTVERSVRRLRLIPCPCTRDDRDFVIAPHPVQLSATMTLNGAFTKLNFLKSNEGMSCTEIIVNHSVACSMSSPKHICINKLRVKVSLARHRIYLKGKQNS